MNITTGCPACGKTLTLDVRHKEAYAPPDKMVTAALAICEACREPLRIELKISSEKETR